MRILRKSFIALGAFSLCLANTAFAQAELHEAIDAGDVAAAQKIVKSGTAEEIYCGKLSADDAVKVYEKIF